MGWGNHLQEKQQLNDPLWARLAEIDWDFGGGKRSVWIYFCQGNIMYKIRGWAWGWFRLVTGLRTGTWGWVTGKSSSNQKEGASLLAVSPDCVIWILKTSTYAVFLLKSSESQMIRGNLMYHCKESTFSTSPLCRRVWKHSLARLQSFSDLSHAKNWFPPSSLAFPGCPWQRQVVAKSLVKRLWGRVLPRCNPVHLLHHVQEACCCCPCPNVRDR